MKQFLLPCVLLIFSSAFGQTPLFEESFESYTVGDYIAESSSIWSTWTVGGEGTDEDGQISDEQANSGTQSLKVFGSVSGGPMDVYLPIGLDDAYEVSFRINVPIGYSGWMNVQENLTPGIGWAFDLLFGSNGQATLSIDQVPVAYKAYTQQYWTYVSMRMDTVNHRAEISINGVCMANIPFDALIGGVNFYSGGDGVTECLYYIDDVVVVETGVVFYENCIDIPGCMDETACNFMYEANFDDGSCTYPGCNDFNASNYDEFAGCDDGSCTYSGCTDSSACNYNSYADNDDGSCTYPGCNDFNACNYDEFAGCYLWQSCTYPGCTDSTAINYDANAGCDDGSCISSFGALDIIAPSSIYYSDTLEVNLMITGGQDVYGAYASLQYDTSLLLLIGDNLGTYFGDDVLTSPAQDNNGIIEFGATNMGPVSGANGDGLFYTLRFIPVGPIEPSNSETLISIINNEAYTSEGLPGGLFYPEASTLEIIYEAEVWPGDLNHDYEVNVSDILPIGYFYGENGPERPDATLQWESQPCPLWDVGMDFPGDGFYKVFADGNGDGEIQLSDQVAVGININQSVVGMAPFEDELNMMVMGGGDITPVVISSVFNPNTIDIDIENEVTLVVSATTDTSNQNLFHGISVSIDLSEILNDANNVSVDYSNSGMGELNSTMIALDYAEDYQLDVAITRTNNNYLLGEFELFSITLPLIDLPSGQYQIPIVVNESNNSEGASVLTTVIPSTLILNSSNSIEEQSNYKISVYPNPTSNNLTVDLGNLTGVNTSIKLYDSSSKLVFEKQSSATLLIDVSGFAKGLYTLELSTSDKVLRSQVVVE